MDLSHVLWIGGGQGSGKSPVARALSRRFDLQLYVIDHRVWVHEPRLPESEFHSLSLDERSVDPTPGEMLGWFVTTSRHRFRLVLEDLRALPPSPIAVVEGVQLFPTSVSAVLREPGQALFLISDLDEQRARLLARGPIPGTSDGVRARENATERELLISRRLATEAADLRLASLLVDAPLEEMIDRAAAHFRPLLERGPRAVDLAAIRRFENDVLATQIRLHRASLGESTLGDVVLAFACECGTPGCADDIGLTLAEYDAVSAAGDRSLLRRPRP